MPRYLWAGLVCVALIGCESARDVERLSSANERSYVLANGDSADQARAYALIDSALAVRPGERLRCAREGVAWDRGPARASDVLRVKLCARLAYLRWQRGDTLGTMEAYEAALPGAHVLPDETMVSVLGWAGTVAQATRDTARALALYDMSERLARPRALNRIASAAAYAKGYLLSESGAASRMVPEAMRPANVLPFVLTLGFVLGAGFAMVHYRLNGWGPSGRRRPPVRMSRGVGSARAALRARRRRSGGRSGSAPTRGPS